MGDESDHYHRHQKRWGGEDGADRWKGRKGMKGKKETEQKRKNRAIK